MYFSVYVCIICVVIWVNAQHLSQISYPKANSHYRLCAGVYVNQTRSTHHEGFCSIAGMQYRISSTSHTQTAATAVAAELHEQVRLSDVSTVIKDSKWNCVTILNRQISYQLNIYLPNVEKLI